MDTFKGLQTAMSTHFADMVEGASHLFVVDVDRDKLWERYLASFPDGTNEILKVRTEHDCSACRHFIKSFGNVVAIKNSIVTTIWDFSMPGSKYDPVLRAMEAMVKSAKVCDVFVTKFSTFGIASNKAIVSLETTKPFGNENSKESTISGSVRTWDHMCVYLPDKFVNRTHKTDDSVRGELHAIRDVFKRSLDEITPDAVSAVLDLIAQNSLYKGEEWLGALNAFQKHQDTYLNLPCTIRDDYVWEESVKVGGAVGKIRNHSIGTLLVDVSNGMDLNEAVRKYEAMVAPSSYRRPNAVYTAKMLKDAEKTLTDLGCLDSLGRRHAGLGDITVNNILFANRDVARALTGVSVLSDMAREIGVSPKNFDRIETIAIDKFLSDVLPTAGEISVFLDNRHSGNMVSLIAPTNADSPSMFKWANGFSWAYAGNITDSMKQRVKAAGGAVDGVLRFSIQWNENHDNENDFDAHCIEPTGNEIYYRNKGHLHKSTGMLDVDIISPSRQIPGGVAVENITWSDIRQMPEGIYSMFVHNYTHNGGRSGFTAEVEFDGQIHSFAYNRELRRSEKVPVADVTYNKKTGFSIVEKIPASVSSREMWGLSTNQFHPVSVVMMSPNYWDGQDGIGNRHVFFMLEGCVNPENPNGFFNEYLKNDLTAHKRVFEALGARMRVAPSESQLSGVGFSTTQRNELIVRVDGHVNRTLKVIF